MAARQGMANLIQVVRGYTSVGTADTTAGGTTWWTDDQLQEVLDKYRYTYKEIELIPMSDYVLGVTTYTEYRIPEYLRWLEEDGTASGWAIRTSTGGTAPTYTTNYEARMVEFAADTAGTAYFLSCRTYNVYRAAADVWDQKAAFVAAKIDWESDNHKIKGAQEYQHYQMMAKQYRAMAGATQARFFRVDETPL